jgi:bifunctional enzyme CysN/CysC
MQLRSLRLVVCGSDHASASDLARRLACRNEFVIAGTRGPAAGLRDLVVNAAEADCAVIVIDAERGVDHWTRRHAHIAALLGIDHIIGAAEIAGEDDHVRECLAAIQRDFDDALAATATATPDALQPTVVPIGPELIERLTGPAMARDAATRPFRLPIGRVQRLTDDSPGLRGRIASGALANGEAVMVAPGGSRATVQRIASPTGERDQAVAGEEVTVTLSEPVEARPGDMLADPDDPPTVSDLLQATVAWAHDAPLLRGRSYLLAIGETTVGATVSPLKYRLDLDSLERVAATRLERDEVGRCDLKLTAPIAFDPYRANRTTGAFSLRDRLTGEMVGAGMIEFALRRSHNLHWQTVTVDRAARAQALGQSPCVLWMTGLSGAGKSTIADRVEAELHRRGHHTYLLDGDNVRHGLNRDLGFTDADRVENIRRVAEVSRLMLDAGLIVIVSFISPFRSERSMAREMFDPGQFLEVYVDTPLDVAEERDPKGLYRKARAGELTNFTGIDSPYEPPESPEVHIETTRLTVDESAEAVLAALATRPAPR